LGVKGHDGGTIANGDDYFASKTVDPAAKKVSMLL